MDVVDLPLAGLKLFAPKVFADERGFFVEVWRRDQLERAGVDVDFLQDNHSRSVQHTVRGMHLQRAGARGPGQAKLVRVARGRVLDVAVDVRPESPTFGRWHAEQLDDVAHHALFIPAGFAHGFCVLSEVADVCYKVNAPYDPAAEVGFAFDDADVGIRWPVGRPQALLSKRDSAAASFRDAFPEAR
ncbi:MAG: dTDP-4-dehydrorhamnose 3,5-epimerase [Deltaproteobacteria bacterium]|nr:dTDP-4-dehydrorhamnose 3,5-epimerase [Deltaproteobacteria bacterium]